MHSEQFENVPDQLVRCVGVEMFICALYAARERALMTGGKGLRPLLELIDELIVERRSWVYDAEAIIVGVDDARHRELLRHRYIDGWTWESLAFHMNYSERHVHRIHDAALQTVAENLMKKGCVHESN